MMHEQGRTISTREWLLFMVVSLCLARISAQSPALEKLKRVEDATSLDLPDVKPWHLKVSFQTFGPDDVAADHGTMEEWWVPGASQISIASGGYTATELRNGNGVYRTPGADSAPFDLDLIRGAIVHPMPSPAWVQESSPELRVGEKVGKLPLDCLLLSHPLGKGLNSGHTFGKRAPLGLFPTYCTDSGDDRLRFVADSGTQFVVFSRLGRFAGRMVAIDLWVQRDGHKTVTAHVETLSGMLPDNFKPENTSGLASIEPHALSVEADVMKGLLVSKRDVIYPESAKASHTSGTVIFHASIGRDGHIRSLRVTQAPDPDLAMSALQSVRHWIYKPYLLHGIATEVDTTITVHFEFG